MNEYRARLSPPSTDSSRYEFDWPSESFRYTLRGVKRSAGSVSITGTTFARSALLKKSSIVVIAEAKNKNAALKNQAATSEI